MDDHSEVGCDWMGCYSFVDFLTVLALGPNPIRFSPNPFLTGIEISDSKRFAISSIPSLNFCFNSLNNIPTYSSFAGFLRMLNSSRSDSDPWILISSISLTEMKNGKWRDYNTASRWVKLGYQNTDW